MAENKDQQDLIKLLADESRERKKLSEESKKASEAAKNKEKKQKEHNKSLKGQLLTQFKINDALEAAEISSKNIVSAIKSQNKSQVQFQKSLGLSVSDANKITKNINLSALGSKNLAVTAIGTQKAFGNINKSLGIGSNLIEKQAEAAGRFALTLGMSVEAQNNLAKRSAQTGQSVENLVLGQIGVVKGVESELGARLNIAEVLDEAASIGGQIRAQLGGNVNELTRAVAVSKELGFELKAIAGTSKALLDFQSNIEAELEAELLTGKQLNLEQARLFALTGDYEGLTREIANNVGDFYDFSKLNVLQQDAIAKSVGMTSDQLADQLFNQASINELKEKARAEDDQATLANLEALDIQKQFELVTLKIKSAFVSVAAALNPFGKIFAFAAKHADLLLGAIIGVKIASAIVARNIARSAAGAAATSAMINPVGAIAGGLLAAGLVATITSLIRNSEPVDDVAIPPGGATFVTGPAGSFKLNPQDGLVAGTNLGGGGGKSSEEIVTMAAKAATRAISVDFNSVKFNSVNSVDSMFA